MPASAAGWLPEWEIRGARPGGFLRRVSPPQLFVGSFAALVFICMLGLRTLPGLYTGEPLGWIDAFFTATSAVCVTGLIVVDTATYFTPLGQAYLLLFIQLGGLGMLTFTSVIILSLGRRLSVRQELLATGPARVTPHVDFRRLTQTVVGFTFAIEAVAALLLYALWVPDLGGLGAIWPAIFHSVSAFCNAGFSIFYDSLEGFQQAPALLGLIMLLIVVGGIGFLTVSEVRLWGQAAVQRRHFRLSLHSRLVLATTAVLLLGGWAAYVWLEWESTLGHLPPAHRLVNGLFMSVTARTAGFNTVPMGEVEDSTGFLTILLMFIGASPGSTAGGVKTTTIALMGLLAWSRLRGRRIVSVWGRSVPEETVQRAVGLFVVAFGVVTAAILAFTITEAAWRGMDGSPWPFLMLMFEATSAFNTVGLSMGVTGELSQIGRILTTVLMFAGRVGPLTLAAAIAVAGTRPRARYRYANEDVVVG